MPHLCDYDLLHCLRSSSNAPHPLQVLHASVQLQKNPADVISPPLACVSEPRCKGYWQPASNSCLAIDGEALQRKMLCSVWETLLWQGSDFKIVFAHLDATFLHEHGSERLPACSEPSAAA